MEVILLACVNYYFLMEVILLACVSYYFLMEVILLASVSYYFLMEVILLACVSYSLIMEVILFSRLGRVSSFLSEKICYEMILNLYICDYILVIFVSLLIGAGFLVFSSY